MFYRVSHEYRSTASTASYNRDYSTFDDHICTHTKQVRACTWSQAEIITCSPLDSSELFNHSNNSIHHSHDYMRSDLLSLVSTISLMHTRATLFVA